MCYLYNISWECRNIECVPGDIELPLALTLVTVGRFDFGHSRSLFDFGHSRSLFDFGHSRSLFDLGLL
jgi:hypothetical protein